MATAGILTTLADVKANLQIASTTQTWDAQLNGAIVSASGLIEARCNRHFASQAYTEYYAGIGQKTLQLREYPVSVLTSVSSDTARDFGAASVLDADNYSLDGDTGTVYFDYALSYGNRSIKVVYTAGYTSFPAALTAAAVRLACIMFNERKSAGFSNESLGNFSKGFQGWGKATVASLPQDVEAMLGEFIRYAVSE